MANLIDTLVTPKDKTTAKLAQLGRTLNKRRQDIVAFFDIGVSNGPVEGINGRLEHLRSIALGFSNINHYILRYLIHSGNLISKINANQNRKSRFSSAASEVQLRKRQGH